MPATLRTLKDIPDGPPLVLQLDGQPLQIVDCKSLADCTDCSNITAAIGIATVLYCWCPDALLAFLDLDAWFSMTWNLTIHQGESNQTRLEISRIRSQVTFGRLDQDGLWQLVISYNVSTSGESSLEGRWTANPEECMIGDQNMRDVTEIEELGFTFARDLVRNERWLTGRGMKHEFFIEPMGVAFDAFGDGIAMNPHWLYNALDLTKCTACRLKAVDQGALSRCGRCGTSTYCSADCQRQDWPVHKAICMMTLEDRGKALHLSQNGGLVKRDWSQGSDADGTVEN